MRDFEKLVKKLRYCSKPGNCNLQCPRFSFAEDCIGKLTTEAADAIEKLLAAVPHWISVDERLPTDEDGDPWDRCIVYTDEDTIQTLPLCKVGNGYVTHWLPLPEPPKEVE